MININLDIPLLKLFIERKNYEQYFEVVDMKSLAPEAQIILSDYEYYYKQHKNEDINLIEFVSLFFSTLHPDLGGEDAIYYKNIFSRIEETYVDDQSSLIQLLRQQKLWNQLEKFKNKEFDTFKMEELLQQFNEVRLIATAEQDPDLFTQTFEERIVATKNKYIPWQLSQLNELLVGIPKGQFVLVCGGKDAGKSAFGIDVAVQTVPYLQKNQKVLYFNNEQPCREMHARIQDRILNKNNIPQEQYLDYCAKNPDKRDNALLPIQEKIMLFNASGKTTKFIEEKCRKYNPGLIVLDQIDNIKHTLKGSAEFRPYEGLYAWVREVAKKYDCPLVGFTQAKNQGKITHKDGSKDYKERLYLDDAAGSNVDKQAHCDVFIGLGHSKDAMNIRIINVDSFKDSGCRKGYFPCRLLPHVSKFVDLRG